MLRTYTVDPNEPVVIREYRHVYEAELARALLEAADIPCAVLAETYTEVAGAPVRLAVRRGDAAEARAALDAPGDPADGEPPAD